jgi:NAD(P)-dependent dehydrogenase (short-subunit alcohol dehydrogenase family)
MISGSLAEMEGIAHPMSSHFPTPTGGQAVAGECAAVGDEIRVNTVHPGVIDTGSNAPIDPNEVARVGVPLRRVGQAHDIANGVLFLASDASSYMTGAELVIDGGMTGGARPRWR